jgi:hypothetical protein
MSIQANEIQIGQEWNARSVRTLRNGRTFWACGRVRCVSIERGPDWGVTHVQVEFVNKPHGAGSVEFFSVNRVEILDPE